MMCLKIQVFGKVQGVWFRVSAKKEAERLSIVGTVRNLKDGSVLMLAEGKESILEKFISWSKEGPEFAQVKEIKIEEVEIHDFEKFEIIRS